MCNSYTDQGNTVHCHAHLHISLYGISHSRELTVWAHFHPPGIWGQVGCSGTRSLRGRPPLPRSSWVPRHRSDYCFVPDGCLNFLLYPIAFSKWQKPVKLGCGMDLHPSLVTYTPQIHPAIFEREPEERIYKGIKGDTSHSGHRTAQGCKVIILNMKHF